MGINPQRKAVMGIFGNAFSGWHLLLILAVILLLFGAAKLPGLAKSVGESVRILRSESKDSTPVGDEPAAAGPGDGGRDRPAPPTAT